MFEKKTVLVYIISAWAIFLLVLSISIKGSSGPKEIKIGGIVITESDMVPAPGFEGISTCEKGKSKAKQDLRDGKFIRITTDLEMRQIDVSVLEKEYGIRIVKVKGGLGMPNHCYNLVMHDALMKKFGNSYLGKAFKERGE